ncbi:carbamoyltransferase HypF [Almyronema epifaneia]|uniref:carbamoyltransferase HypF n=1 Tax=Almyronema epifaneia TaxID=3114805 RepID=UPI00366E84D2
MLKQRLQIALTGLVQGVGFRPFVYRLATELSLTGWVTNSAQGVLIEVEGDRLQIENFCDRLQLEKPPHAQIHQLTRQAQKPTGEPTFTIRPSLKGPKTTPILPDLATCAACLQELFDPRDRRYQYPFINCTHCGPRYSLIEDLPYDRPHTSMKGFTLCPQCQAEYDNPRDRRFHAQPNACPQCGPQLALWEASGQILASQSAALQAAIAALRQGKIVAVKGLGGFHLMVDARHAAAVQNLRQRKHRPDKPFALMFADLQQVQQACQVSALEAALLQSTAAPIVLLRRHSNPLNLAAAIAPKNPHWGIMLPYTPLHHLLLAELGSPLVATSGNRASEPLCTDEFQALQQLSGIADLFLVHNRPIARPIDDSIVRVMAAKVMVLRRARGYGLAIADNPQEQSSPTDSLACAPPLLAVGAHLKNTIAIALPSQTLLSQHIGDLETPATLTTFEQTISRLAELYDWQPAVIACDRHPDYLSTQYAEATGLPVVAVQHHQAHVLACMAEHQLLGETVLGIAWDGTGYGLDGTLWGSEFFRVSGWPLSIERVAHLRPFGLPGGDRAIKDPRRSALGLLYGLWGEALFSHPAYQRWLPAFSTAESSLLAHSLKQGINVPLTSSMGRLFDGIAAIAGLATTVSFEGQAAMQLEFAQSSQATTATYPLEPSRVIDWRSLVIAILQDLDQGVAMDHLSAKFHNSLIALIGAIAAQLQIEKVVLSGGCFQNQRLLEGTVKQLQQQGFQPYWPQQIPPNDGSIAFGQLIAANSQLLKPKSQISSPLIQSQSPCA